MTKKWAEVAADPDFAALGDDEKDALRDRYFTNVVAPDAPADQIAPLRARFDAATGYGQRGRSTQVGPTATDMQGAGGPKAEEMPKPAGGLASAKSRVGSFRAPPPQRGGSVLDRTYAEAGMAQPDAPPQDLSPRARAPAVQPSNDRMQETPLEQQLGADIRKATGSSGGGAAVQGIASGFAGLGKAVPGLVAAGADAVGADSVSEFALGAANRAEGFSQSVQPQGGYYNKLIGNVFASTVQSLPSMAFGLGGATEIVAGKAVADVAAKQATNNAMKALFVQTASQEYADTRNRIDPATGRHYEPAEAAARSAITAGAEVLGERIGYHEQMAVLKAAIGKRNIPSDQLAKVWATELFKEIPGEELTTAIQFLADKFGPAAKSPKATLADYLEQAADTAIQTIGQTALMGAPAGIRAGYGRADAAIAYKQAELAGFHVEPPLSTDTPDVQHRKTLSAFKALAAQYGIDPAAVKRATTTAAGMPVDQVGPFLSRLAVALQRRRLVAKPVDEHALDAVAAGPIDDPKLAQQQDEDLTGLSEPSTPAAQAVDNIGAILNPGQPDRTGLANPVEETPGAAPIDESAHAAATSPKNDLPEPTPAQKEAGNYPKGHHTIAGLDISIENPQGSIRRSKPDSPVKWETEMQHHYGYIRGTVGMDGDHVDTFIKPGTPDDFAGTAFVVDQVDPATGKPDEHKIMLGFDTEEEAQAAYQSNYSAGWKGLGAITATSVDGLKTWLKTGDTTKPFKQEARGEPQQPDVQPTPGQPETSGPGQRPDAAGSGGNLGQRPADARGGRAGPAAAPVAGSQPAVPVRGGSEGAGPVARTIARAGVTPAAAKPLELRPNADGSSAAWHDGREVIDFESGEPVTIPAGTSDAQALQIIKDSGSFGRRTKYFDAPKEAPAPDTTTAAGGSSTAPNTGTGETPGVGSAEAPQSVAPAPAITQPAAPEKADQPDATATSPQGPPAKPPKTDQVDQAAPEPDEPSRSVAQPPAISPSEPATAPKQRKLTDAEVFADNYAAFDGVTVEQSVTVAGTGQTAVLKMDAAKAMRSLDARLKALSELRACIGRAA